MLAVLFDYERVVVPGADRLGERPQSLDRHVVPVFQPDDIRIVFHACILAPIRICAAGISVASGSPCGIENRLVTSCLVRFLGAAGVPAHNNFTSPAHEKPVVGGFDVERDRWTHGMDRVYLLCRTASGTDEKSCPPRFRLKAE